MADDGFVPIGKKAGSRTVVISGDDSAVNVATLGVSADLVAGEARVSQDSHAEPSAVAEQELRAGPKSNAVASAHQVNAAVSEPADNWEDAAEAGVLLSVNPLPASFAVAGNKSADTGASAAPTFSSSSSHSAASPAGAPAAVSRGQVASDRESELADIARYMTGSDDDGIGYASVEGGSSRLEEARGLLLAWEQAMQTQAAAAAGGAGAGTGGSSSALASGARAVASDGAAAMHDDDANADDGDDAGAMSSLPYLAIDVGQFMQSLGMDEDDARSDGNGTLAGPSAADVVAMIWGTLTGRQAADGSSGSISDEEMAQREQLAARQGGGHGASASSSSWLPSDDVVQAMPRMGRLPAAVLMDFSAGDGPSAGSSVHASSPSKVSSSTGSNRTRRRRNSIVPSSTAIVELPATAVAAHDNHHITSRSTTAAAAGDVDTATWCANCEALLGSGMAFHTSSDTIEGDVRSWVRGKRRAAVAAAAAAVLPSSSPLPPLSLAILPYPSTMGGQATSRVWEGIATPWTQRFGAHASSSTGIADQDDGGSGDDAGAAVVDVVRSLIECCHRDIGFKQAAWRRVVGIARLAAAAQQQQQRAAGTSFYSSQDDSSNAADSAGSDTDTGHRGWQDQGHLTIASHPLLRLLVPMLDRSIGTSTTTSASAAPSDDDGTSEEQLPGPREAAAAAILHAAAIGMMVAAAAAVEASGEMGVHPDLHQVAALVAATPIAQWCVDAAPVAADVLDMWCGAFGGRSLASSPSFDVVHDTVEQESSRHHWSSSNASALPAAAAAATSSVRLHGVRPPPIPAPTGQHRRVDGSAAAASASSQQQHRHTTRVDAGGWPSAWEGGRDRDPFLASSVSGLDEAAPAEQQRQQQETPPAPGSSSSSSSNPVATSVRSALRSLRSKAEANGTATSSPATGGAGARVGPSMADIRAGRLAVSAPRLGQHDADVIRGIHASNNARAATSSSSVLSGGSGGGLGHGGVGMDGDAQSLLMTAAQQALRGRATIDDGVPDSTGASNAAAGGSSSDGGLGDDIDILRRLLDTLPSPSSMGLAGAGAGVAVGEDGKWGGGDGADDGDQAHADQQRNPSSERRFTSVDDVMAAILGLSTAGGDEDADEGGDGDGDAYEENSGAGGVYTAAAAAHLPAVSARSSTSATGGSGASSAGPGRSGPPSFKPQRPVAAAPGKEQQHQQQHLG